MKEDEFRALLKLEGRELITESTYFRTWDFDARSGVRHTLARVITEEGDTVMETDYVQRRYYAIQSLIKRYYGDRV